MLVSVFSVLATLSAAVLGAPQNGYLYPQTNVDFALTAEEAKLQEHLLPFEAETAILQDQLLQEPTEEESRGTPVDHGHDGDHDHDHHHHDHHIGLDWLREAVPGEPGVDYPIYWRAPLTAFNCRSYHDGYYADMETGCQVFHVCNDRGDRTFLCPNGTIFNQQHFTCQWWFNVDCARAQDFYSLNVNIGAVPEETQSALTVKGAGRVQETEQVLTEEVFEPQNKVNVVDFDQESVQQREQIDTESENAILTYETLDQVDSSQYGEQQESLISNEIPFVSQNDDQSALYVTEQGPFTDVEQATIPAAQEYPEYTPVQGETELGSAQEETSVDEQVADYSPVQKDSDFYSIQKETEIDTVLQGTDATPVQQDSDFYSIQQQTEFDTVLQGTDATPVQKDSDFYSIQQETEFDTVLQGTDATPVQQEEATIIPIQEDDGVISLKQEIDSLHVKQETVFASSQVENDILPEKYNVPGQQVAHFVPIQQQPDLVPTQEETDYVTVQPEPEVLPFQQETDIVLEEQERNVDIKEQENDYVSEQQDFFHIQQESDSLPIQHQNELVPVQHVNDVVHEQQQESNLISEQETDLPPIQQDTGVVPEQKTSSPPLQQDSESLSEQQGSSVTPSQQQTDFVALKPQTEYTSVQQESATISIQQESEYFSDQPGDDSVPVQQETVFNPVEQEPDSLPVRQVGNFVSTQQESDYAHEQQETVHVPVKQEADVTYVQQKTDVPVHQEFGTVSVQQETGIASGQPKIDVPVQQESDLLSFQRETNTHIQQKTDIASAQQEIDGPVHQGSGFLPHLPVQEDIEYGSVTEEIEYVTAHSLPESTDQLQNVYTYDQHDTDFSIQHENELVFVQQETTDSPVQPVDGTLFVGQGTEQYPEQQQSETFSVQQEMTDSPVLSEHGTLFVDQGTEQYPEQQQSETFSVQQEMTDSPVQSEHGALFVEQGTEQYPEQQQSETFSVEQEKTYSPVQSEHGALFVEQGTEQYPEQQQSETFSVQQETTDFPVQSEHGALFFEQGTEQYLEQQQSETFSVQQETIDSAVLSEHGTIFVEQGTELYPEQQQGETFSVHQETTDSPVQSEHSALFVEQGTEQYPEQQQNEHANVHQDTDSDTVQETSYVPEQKEAISPPLQQEIVNVIHQQNIEQAFVHQETNLVQNHQNTDGVFAQQGTDYDRILLEQANLPVHEEPEYFPVQHNPSHDASRQEPALFPIQQISTDFSAQEEPASVVVQGDVEHTSTKNYFETKEEHSREPVNPLLPVPNPDEEAADVPETLPEVLPEAESTYEVHSAVIPDISVLYGVPIVHSFTRAEEESTPFASEVSSEVADEIPDVHNSIVPGVFQVKYDISEENPITLPTLSVQETNEIIPLEPQYQEPQKLNPVVHQLNEVPELNEVQLLEEILDETTESEQVDVVTEVPGSQIPIQFPEKVLVKQNEVYEENMPTITYIENITEDYGISNIVPEVIEDATTFNFLQNEIITGIVDESLSHGEKARDDLVTVRTIFADSENDEDVSVTEIPSSYIPKDDSYLTEESPKTDTIYHNHDESSYPHEFSGDTNETEDSGYLELTTETATEAQSPELQATTIPSLNGGEYKFQSIFRSNLEFNKTTNATSQDAKRTDLVSEVKHNEGQINEILESTTNPAEGEDLQEAITVVPEVQNEIINIAHEDPVLSLVYKTSLTASNGNGEEESTTVLQSQEEYVTAIPREEESATLFAIKTDGSFSFERDEESTVSPGDQEYVPLPFAIQEQENKVEPHGVGEQEEFVAFPQLVDLDQLFGIPRQEKTETENEQHPFIFHQTPEVPSTLYQAPKKPQTLYEAPVENLPAPSNLYLPPL